MTSRTRSLLRGTAALRPFPISSIEVSSDPAYVKHSIVYRTVVGDDQTVGLTSDVSTVLHVNSFDFFVKVLFFLQNLLLRTLMVKSRYGLNFSIHEQEGLYPDSFFVTLRYFLREKVNTPLTIIRQQFNYFSINHCKTLYINII